MFKHLGISEGFNQTNVTTLYQDENGTIWAAGVGGVVRYRGLQTEEPLMPERAAELFRPMNVKGIYGEQNGLIYFYQLRNIVEYDLRRETFRPLFTDSLLDSRSISAATVRGGRVYAAAGDRIVIAAPDGKCSQLLLPPMSEVSALACTAGGVLYVGTLHSGLYRLDERGAAECILPTASKISSLFEDSRGDLWVCTRSEGLYRLDAGGGVRRFVHDPRHPEGLADNYVRCICEDDEGRLWIGMMFGLDCYDPASDRFYHFGRSDNPLYGMRNLTVECIMRDRRGAIWFGSFYTGISYFHPHEALFRVVPIEGGDTTWTIVADVTLDRRGDVWAGTSDKGLYFYDRTRRRGRFFNMGNSGIPSNNVKSIRYDAGRDQLWLGMFMGGVCVYDIPSGRFERLKIADQGGGSENIEIVHSLSREGDAIYAGTYAGVYRIDMRTRRAERILNQQRVFNVLSGGDGWLYVVTGQVNFRVYRRDEAGVYQLYFNRVVQQDMVTSLFRDDRGRAWVGTTRSGALLFDRERKEFVVYDRAACGIASDYVSAISQTPSGLMVFGTNAGLSVVNADSLRSENFNIRNGFPLLSLENGCLWRGGGDEMLAGGVDGIVSFAGRDLIRTGRAPQLFFAALSVNERPVRAGDRTGILDRAMPYAKSISLGHRYSIVDIAFGTDNAVDFNLGDYQYKLIGYDEAWRPLPGSIIRYMNLPPGHYRLAVQSRPTKLLDGGGRIELGIRVYPPFYASIPAYILYVLLIMLITAWVVRYYYTKKQLEQSLAMERMAREQQERITQWKLVFFTNISHEFRTPLTLIQGQLDLLARQEMPGVLKGYLMSVRRNALRLRDLVNELIDFRKQEQGYMSLKVSRQDLVAYLADVCGTFEEYGRIREVELRYEPGMERLEVPFDSVQLQKVFYNLISNAFKHTDRGGRITVTLSADDAQAVVKVADTGHGIEEKFFTTIFERFYHHEADTQDAGVGIGLALSKGIVELHGGRIGGGSGFDLHGDAPAESRFQRQCQRRGGRDAGACPSGARGRLPARARTDSGVGGAAASAGRRGRRPAAEHVRHHLRAALPGDAGCGRHRGAAAGARGAARPDRERRADARDVGNGAVRGGQARIRDVPYPGDPAHGPLVARTAHHGARKRRRRLRFEALRHGRADGQVQRHGAQPPAVAAQVPRRELRTRVGGAFGQSDGRGFRAQDAGADRRPSRQRIAGRRDAEPRTGSEPHGAVRQDQGRLRADPHGTDPGHPPARSRADAGRVSRAENRRDRR